MLELQNTVISMKLSAQTINPFKCLFTVEQRRKLR